MNKNNSKPSFVKRSPLVVGDEYAQLLIQLKERFRKSQVKAAVKVNTTMLEYYWDMGREISKLHAEAKWGSAFFECLCLDLKTEFPGQAGFSATNIKYAKRWYEFYSQENIIRQQVVDELCHQSDSQIRHQAGDEFQMPVDFGLVPWRHHIEIFTHSKSVEEALFYIERTISVLALYDFCVMSLN